MNDLSNEALAVIEKVKKLLALASGNANEFEAQAAAQKAQDLLSAYNLDMATVGNERKSSNRKDSNRKGGLYAWQRSIWQATCELNFCMYWSIKGLFAGQSYEHRILGRQENVISAELMAGYLQDTIERLTRQYAKEGNYQSIFVRELIAYREGMATRLVERLQQIRRERLAEDKRKSDEEAARRAHPGYASTGNAIVLASVIEDENDLNNDHLNGWEPGTTAQNRRDQKARQAAANTAYEAELARKRAEDPEYDVKIKAASEKYWADYFAKAAKKQSRSRTVSTPRPRAQSEAEKRAGLRTFQSGYSKANDVGLDGQIDDDKKHRIA